MKASIVLGGGAPTSRGQVTSGDFPVTGADQEAFVTGIIPYDNVYEKYVELLLYF